VALAVCRQASIIILVHSFIHSIHGLFVLGILVDKTGSRFVNELDYRSKVTDAILHHGHPFTEGGNTVAFLLLNDEAVNLFQASAFGFYVGASLFTLSNYQ
jgi:hypothetical protein